MPTPTVMMAELTDLRQDLDSFLASFDPCISTRPSRKHLRTYVGGQTGPLERKSIEPIALESEVAPRTLQEFLEIHRWDHEAVRRRVQELVMERHADPSAIGVIDESGMPKKGRHTLGVQRQYCGATGKQDNCVVSVHLGYVTDTFATLVDGDVFLPEEWCNDPVRRAAAGVPLTLGFRTKLEIGLDLVDRARASGVTFTYFTADALYGRSAVFREGLTQRGYLYVVEIPRDLSGWRILPALETGPRGGQHLALGAVEARPAETYWLRGGPPWQRFVIKETEKGPVVWEVRQAPFWAWKQGLPGPPEQLLVARNPMDGQLKYFLTNADASVPLTTLLRVAFGRAEIEHLFEVAKGEVGLDHFEVRKYLPLQRHLILSMVSQLFLMEAFTRLRGKKSLVECRPSPCSRRGAA